MNDKNKMKKDTMIMNVKLINNGMTPISDCSKECFHGEAADDEAILNITKFHTNHPVPFEMILMI